MLDHAADPTRSPLGDSQRLTDYLARADQHQIRPDNDEDDDDLCKPTADGLHNLEKMLQRHQRHEDGLLEPWRAALQQTPDRADNERRDREDNERRHRQTQRVAWISLATAVIATVISVLK